MARLLVVYAVSVVCASSALAQDGAEWVLSPAMQSWLMGLGAPGALMLGAFAFAWHRWLPRTSSVGS